MANTYDISTVILPDDDNTYYIKDSTARNGLANKIDNPSTKASGNILMFNGTEWVAGTAPSTGVVSVNVKTDETALSVDNADTSNPKIGMNISANSGNVALSKESDGLKANVADSALTIAKTSGLQIALDAKELSSNKVSSWSSTTDNTHYPGEKLVKDEIDNVRAVAEGKTKSYVINAQADITGTKGPDDSYTNVTAITGISLSELKIGDVILIKAVDVPDYWVSQITPSYSLNKMETSKIDLDEYAKTEDLGDLAFKDNATGTFTPEGTISAPTITVTPTTTTVNSIEAVGTLPSWTATYNSEILTFSWNAGSLPTKGSNTTVATGIRSATASQPAFTGTQGNISVS